MSFIPSKEELVEFFVILILSVTFVLALAYADKRENDLRLNEGHLKMEDGYQGK